MKKILLISVITSYVTSECFSQVNYPFPHENGTWGECSSVIFYPFPGNWYWICSTAFYTSKGDSVLNGETYFKVYATDESGTIVYDYPYLLRQDGEKIYLRLNGFDIDTLLYDFSLQPGDTASVYNIFSSGTYGNVPVVDSVGTVMFGNESRKCIYFNTLSCNNLFSDTVKQLQWIEGMGSTDGLFIPYNGSYIVDGGMFLTCFRENNEIKYGDTCNVVFTGIQELDEDAQLILFPNPSNDIFRITLPSTIKSRVSLSVFDIAGKNIFSSIEDAKQQITLDLREFPGGTYYVTLQSAATFHFGKALLIKD